MTRADGLRAAFLETAARMSESRLSPGKSGNFSARTDAGFLITPTGIAWTKLTADDVVEVGLDGETRPGQRLPSSEWRLHMAIYKARADARAVVHTHSLHATALACLRRGIPAFHYMIAEFGGDRVACSGYATYGSETLARFAVKALGPRHACLMANHGSLTLGDDLHQAFERALSLEALAAQYVTALQVGQPKLLPAKEMKRVLSKFSTYGKQTEVRTRR
jgi:L-fuculose-phosphate aldolase